MKYALHHRILTMIAAEVLLCIMLAGQTRREYVFTHVNILPMHTETLLVDHAVRVFDGKIREIGPSSSVTIPKGSSVIDAKGRFMIPALSDMHVHLEGDAWNIMFPAGSKFKPDEINFDDILFVYLAHGITMVDVLFAFPEHIPLREKIKRHEMQGPRLILSRMIDGAGKAWPPPLGIWINNAGEAAAAVREIHEQGYDRIKVYSFLDRPSYDTIIATARNLGLPVDGHVPFSTSVEHVVSSGQKMIAHVEEIMKFTDPYSPENLSAKAELLAESDIWVTSSLILNRNLNTLLRDSAGQFSKPGTQYLHPMASGIWAYIYQHIYKPIPESHRRKLIEGYNLFQRPFVREFARRGGKLLTGTDALVPSTLPGISLHEELEELVDAGVRPFEVLRASTTSPYDFLGESDHAGTIEVGKDANVVLLDGNPLDNISHARKIFGVMTQNRWIPKEEIEKRLGDIRDAFVRLQRKKSQ